MLITILDDDKEWILNKLTWKDEKETCCTIPIAELLNKLRFQTFFCNIKNLYICIEIIWIGRNISESRDEIHDCYWLRHG